MKTNRLRDSLLSLFAVLLVYALSYGLSLWREAARLYLVNNWRPVVFNIQMIAILIIMATSLMALNWFINSKMRPNALVSWILFISGGILIFSFFFPISTKETPSFLKHMFPGALLSFASTFIIIIAIIGLMRSLKNRNRNRAHGSNPLNLKEGFMKNNRALESLVLLFSVLLMFVIAYGLDLCREAAIKLILKTFNPGLFTVCVTAIHGILITCLIALNWFLNSKARPNAVVSRITFVGGCLLLLSPLVLQFVKVVPFFLNQLFRMNLLTIACAFITVIGGSGIWSRAKSQRRQENIRQD